MTVNEYTQGSKAVVYTTFELNGAPTDPATVTLTIRYPSGSETSFAGAELEHTPPGYYQKVIGLDDPGAYFWEWRGDGNGIDVSSPGKLLVLASRVQA